MTASVLLPADLRSAGEARRVAEQECRCARLPDDVTDTAVLLTSETVTNAIVHGRSRARLTVSAAPGSVRVEVGDEDSRLPAAQDPDPDALGGRGIGLLEACADAWGVIGEPYGKVVWFEIRVIKLP